MGARRFLPGAKQPYVHQLAPYDESLKLYSLEEVAEHDVPEDLWMVIDDLVYDVTKMYKTHPGGNVIATWAGRDASDVWRVWHRPGFRPKLKAYLIGRVPPQHTSQYEIEKRQMHEKIEASGWYEPNKPWYVFILAHAYAFLALGIASFLLTDNFWLHTLGAMAIAECWHQLAFFGHDLLHNQIFKSPKAAHIFGLTASGFMGITASWWKYTHNWHHATVNEWERDPDITHMPLIGVTSKMFLHQKSKTLKWYEVILMKVFVPFQHLLYLPVMILSRYNLYIQGAVMLTLGRVPTVPGQQYHHKGKLRLAEAASLVFFLTWTSYMFYTVSVYHGTSRAIWFYFIVHLYSGVLGVQITLSHWERPMHSRLEDGDRENRALTFQKREGIDDCEPTPAQKKYNQVHNEHEWFFQQITTGHNIDHSPFVDWYFGGLNYQVEHHIFPDVPRCHLGKLREIVVPFCERWGIPYTSNPPLPALWSLLMSMQNVAEQVDLYDQDQKKIEVALAAKAKHDAERAARRSRQKTE
jgi:acyl-lipid Delta6-acetylenase / acyl-lipid (9-3)-desaturase